MQSAYPSVHSYLRDEKRNPIGVMLAINTEQGIRYGWSFCFQGSKWRTHDAFEKKKGVLIAYGRAVSQRHPYPLRKFPPAFVEAFIFRAERRFNPKPDEKEAYDAVKN